MRAGGSDDPRCMIRAQRVYNVIHAANLNSDLKDDWANSKSILEGWKSKAATDKVTEINHYVGVNVNEGFVVLSNSQQLDLLKQYGPNLICIDSTHQCTAYDHMVTTILIRDGRNEGYPVVYCLSRNKDEATWREFFKVLKSAIGTLKPAYFLSDDDVSFYNAWCAVMGNPGKRRLCLWHVKKNWGKRYKTLANQDAIKKALERIIDAKNEAEYVIPPCSNIELMSVYNKNDNSFFSQDRQRPQNTHGTLWGAISILELFPNILWVHGKTSFVVTCVWSWLSRPKHVVREFPFAVKGPQIF